MSSEQIKVDVHVPKQDVHVEVVAPPPDKSKLQMPKLSTTATDHARSFDAVRCRAKARFDGDAAWAHAPLRKHPRAPMAVESWTRVSGGAPTAAQLERANLILNPPDRESIMALDKDKQGVDELEFVVGMLMSASPPRPSPAFLATPFRTP